MADPKEKEVFKSSSVFKKCHTRVKKNTKENSFLKKN